jgi:hypothetical protein
MHRVTQVALFLFAALLLAYGAVTRTDGDEPRAPAPGNADRRDEPQLSEPAAKIDPPAPAAPAEAADIATPNHDPHHLGAMQAAAAPASAATPPGTTSADAETVRAEPVAAAPSAPVFVPADNTLYAKAYARLRAAPSTASDVMAKLAANAPLRATARSSDGLWWRVTLADRRIAYVHRDAVTEYQVATTLPATTAPVAAASPPPPVPVRRDRGPLGFVDQAINWIANVASQSSGPPRKVIRAQR